MGHGTASAGSGGGGHGHVPGVVCRSPPGLCRVRTQGWALGATLGDFGIQLPDPIPHPSAVPGVHGRAIAGRGRALAALHPVPYPMPCRSAVSVFPPGRACGCPWTSWLLLSSWVSTGLGGAPHAAGDPVYPRCRELRWPRYPSPSGGCRAAEAVVMAMLPGGQQPGPDHHKSQQGIRAALSPGGISERLTWLLAPPGTAWHPGNCPPPRNTGSHPPVQPPPSPWLPAPCLPPLPARPLSLPPGHEAPALLPAPFWVTELRAASVGRDAGMGRDGMAGGGVGAGQVSGVHGGAGGAQGPWRSPQPVPLWSLQRGCQWRGAGRSPIQAMAAPVEAATRPLGTCWWGEHPA